MKLPVGVSGLLKVMDAHGWTHRVTHGTGTVDAQTLGEPRGDGTRPKIAIQAPCESIAIRARHEDTGRAVCALFVCRTDKDKRAWTMSTAWRGAHADRQCTGCQTGGCGTGAPTPCSTCMEGGCGEPEHTPRQLTTTELRAYLAEEPDRVQDADEGTDEDTDMITHAAEIAEKLQGAHERRQRGEDKDMAEDENVAKDEDRSVWSPEKREVVDTLAESVYDALLKLAEKNAPGEPQSNAVTAERVVELERQLAERTKHYEDQVAHRNELERQLARAEEHRGQAVAENERVMDLLQSAYVAREVPWSDVAAGMMTIARDGTPWMVGTWDAVYSTVTLLRGNDAFPKTPKPGETVRVLVPYVTPEQAETAVREQLGGTAVS